MTKHILIISLFTAFYISQLSCGIAGPTEQEIEIVYEKNRQKALKTSVYKTVFNNATIPVDKHTIAKYLLVEEIIKNFGDDATLCKTIGQTIKEIDYKQTHPQHIIKQPNRSFSHQENEDMNDILYNPDRSYVYLGPKKLSTLQYDGPTFDLSAMIAVFKEHFDNVKSQLEVQK